MDSVSVFNKYRIIFLCKVNMYCYGRVKSFGGLFLVF